MEDEKVEIVWITDGGVVPRVGRIIEGETASLAPAAAADCIRKGWAVLKDEFELDVQAEDC